MMSRGWIWVSTLVVLFSLCFGPRWVRQSTTQLSTLAKVQGRKNTVLFITSERPGLSNVHLATAAALVERHPEVQVHYASFSSLGRTVARVSSQARHSWVTQPSTDRSSDITFHPLTSAPTFGEKQAGTGESYWGMIHPPGIRGINTMTMNLQRWVAPWSAEEHLALFEEIRHVIEVKVDPAVVVLDTLFLPAVDAARDTNRLHAFISPNQPIDSFAARQPLGGVLWKYPAFGSGHPFPVPWRLIPTNAYQILRALYALNSTPALKELKLHLKTHGIRDPLNFFGLYREDTPWITQYAHGASIPLDHVPGNITLTGPIVLSSRPTVEQDAELAAWLTGASTVLINLGSTTIYDKSRAIAMVGAIEEILEAQPDLHVLWKYSLYEGTNATIEDYLDPVQRFIDSDRLRVTKWLTVDPASLMENGLITASVHHGGANCYWETIGAGVPHVVLPSWADHYNFAQLVEDSGIGIWACRQSGPVWTTPCLSEGILKVIDGGITSQAFYKRARLLREVALQHGPGRFSAAAKVAELAASGK